MPKNNEKDDLDPLYSFYKYLFYGGAIVGIILVFLMFAFNYQDIFKEELQLAKESSKVVSEANKKIEEVKSKVLDNLSNMNRINLKFEKNNIEISVFVAITSQQKSAGLSVFEKLGDKEGMLFPYEKEDYYKFWMKNMRFPIDIIWINKDFKIVDITENVSPDTFPQVFTSKKPAQYVLEVNAGFVKNNNVEIGDYVKFDFGNLENKEETGL